MVRCLDCSSEKLVPLTKRCKIHHHEYLKKMIKYQQLDKRKEYERKYRQSDKYKEYQRKYHQLDKVKEYYRKYNELDSVRKRIFDKYHRDELEIKKKEKREND